MKISAAAISIRARRQRRAAQPRRADRVAVDIEAWTLVQLTVAARRRGRDRVR